MSRDLPILPVEVRFISIYKGASGGGVQEEEDQFAACYDFWLREAGIELKLRDGRVLPLFDDADLDVPSIGKPTYFYQPLDVLHEEGLNCVTVVSFDRTWINSDDSVSTAVRGYAYFARPNEGKYGYGVSLRRSSHPSWSTLAHELGHCFGLVHVKSEHNARALAPFEDDVKGLTPREKGANIMAKDPDFGVNDGSLTDSQVKRARLTITSRVCPFAVFFLGGADGDNPVDAVLMTDICARSVVQMF